MNSCCSPAREPSLADGTHAVGSHAASAQTTNPASAQATNPASATGSADSAPADPASAEPALAVRLPGGTFTMGNTGNAAGASPAAAAGDPAVAAYPADGECHVHEVTVAPFEIATHAVSNARFAEFIGQTQYETDAERYGWAFVFGGLLPDDFPETKGVAQAPWWRQVYGADWAHPEGPQSDIADRPDHPVVQVSHTDAAAFCSWDNSRLPTEAEWEFAARGGLAGATFPWGDELEPAGEHRMNVWQGSFPDANSCGDGYYGVAPVDAYEPNGYGLFNVCGNVWEWCSDWFAADYYQHSPPDNPVGPDEGSERVMRGGSYLCHASYCHRYRVAARSSNGPDSSAGNLGFRTARTVAR